MKKRIICGSAAILLTGLSGAMFSAAASRSHEQVAPAIEASAPRVIETVVVERGRYLALTAGCNDCHTPGYAMSGGTVDAKNWPVIKLPS